MIGWKLMVVRIGGMKIVCLTENSPGLRYTVNMLHRRHGVALVVLESSKGGMFFRDLRRYGLWDTAYRVRLVAKRLWPSSAEKKRLDRHFRDAWARLDEDIPQFHTRDVNSAQVREEIERIRPDVIVCQGTTLVRDATIAGVPYPLNIHAGLSPRYRGSRCTEWALAQGDVLNIGPTVHRLTKDIDGGAVLGQSRIQVQEDDTIDSINAKITIAGTEIVSDAISMLKQGEEVGFVPQPEGGTMYMRRQYTRFMAMHVRELFARGELRNMLKRPSCAMEAMVAPWPRPAAHAAVEAHVPVEAHA